MALETTQKPPNIYVGVINFVDLQNKHWKKRDYAIKLTKDEKLIVPEKT